MNDYIGRLVRVFESGNKGSLSVGQSGLDCGCSFGTYQFVLRYGVVIDFLKRFFPEEAKSLYYNGPDVASQEWPGKDYSSSPDDVKKVWLKCYEKAGAEQFFYYEHEQIKDICYLPCKIQIQKKLGLDVDNVNRAFQEAVWSGSVHFGAVTAANMLLTAIEEIGNDWGARQEETFNKFYEKRYEATGYERYKVGIYNGNSEVEVLRPYLTTKPLKKENEDMKKLCLVIDPGHYPGYNPGINPSICEGNVMYQLAEAEKKYCDANYSQYMDCILTRSFDEDPSLELGRGHKAVDMKLSGKYEKVMFMSDHTNATGGTPPDPKVTGVTVFTTQFRKNTYGFLRSLADCVAKVMNSHFLYMDAKPLSTSDSGDWWGVVRGAMDHAKTQAEADKRGVDYAFIMEHGFHTNPTECAFFRNEENIKRMAQAKIDFIMEYLGIKKAATMTAFWLCDGTLEITYAGADGVNLRSGLSMTANNIVGILYKGEKRRVVQGIKMSDGQNWYRLESGEYITANKNYVKYTENSQKKKVGKVTGVAANDVLNVRDFPNSHSGNVTRTLKEGNLVQVIGECYNNGTQWYLVDQGNASNKFKGFVAARYIK